MKICGRGKIERCNRQGVSASCVEKCRHMSRKSSPNANIQGFGTDLGLIFRFWRISLQSSESWSPDTRFHSSFVCNLNYLSARAYLLKKTCFSQAASRSRTISVDLDGITSHLPVTCPMLAIWTKIGSKNRPPKHQNHHEKSIFQNCSRNIPGTLRWCGVASCLRKTCFYCFLITVV